MNVILSTEHLFEKCSFEFVWRSKKLKLFWLFLNNLVLTWSLVLFNQKCEDKCENFSGKKAVKQNIQTVSH